MKVETGNGGFGSSIILFLVVGFFITAIWVVLAVIGLAVWVMWLVSQPQIASVSPSSKLQLSVPVAPPSTEISLSDQDVEARIQSTKEKAAGIAQWASSEPEARKRVFERVFLWECDRRGVKISRIGWKRRDAPSIGDETAKNVAV